MKININLATKEVVISIENTTQKAVLSELTSSKESTTKNTKKANDYFEVIDESYAAGNLSYQTILVHTKIPKLYYLENNNGMFTLYDDLSEFKNCGVYVLRDSDEDLLDGYLVSLVLDEEI